MANRSTAKLSAVYIFLKPYRRAILLLLALTILLSLLAMSTPLITRAFIDKVITANRRELLLPLGFWRIALILLVPLLGFIQTQGIAWVGQRFVFDIRNALYRRMLGLSLRFYSKHSTGMLVNRVMGDTGNVANMLSAQTISIVSDLVCATFAITATFALNWRMAILIVLIAITFLINYRFNIARIINLSRNYRQAFDRLSGGVQNRLAANLAVKSYGTETREQGFFQEQSLASMSLMQQSEYAGNIFHQNTALLQNTGRAVIFFLGCFMILRDEMTYGDVTAFVAYATQMLWPAVRLSELARQLQEVRVSIERIMEIYNEKPELHNRTDAVRVQRLRGRVDFEHVDFAYNSGTPVICDFTLSVQAGETIALVGPTGCGKSTLLMLLMRFYEINGGRLLLDGKDVRSLDLADLRAQFGIVLQDPMLFGISIADNIRYARPDASAEEVEMAARVAEIHDFIAGLPEGYQTEIGHDGMQLSVGQKQRLTIARAVLADPAIMIMDEATSALDSESEAAIQLAMQRVLEDRTSFIVAHRLSTIRNADRIVLMSAGRIQEIGAHAELMTIPNGRYQRLYTRHLGKSVMEDE